MMDDPSLEYKPRAWYEHGTEICDLNFLLEFVFRCTLLPS